MLEDAAGKVLARFPVTTGSAQFPLPIGEWKVTDVARNPVWHYDPKLIANSKKTDEKSGDPGRPEQPGRQHLDRRRARSTTASMARPTPAKVGKTESNGCIRMTNWSAAALAKVVSRDMVVSMRE